MQSTRSSWLSIGLFLASSLVALPIWSQDAQNTRLLESPTVSRQHLAFTYDGDLWISDRDGSNPRRLTRHEGRETSPRFSPDGQWLAFSGEYDGNVDVYLLPVTGGSPRRLTFHPDADEVEGFTPDGKAVLFSSGRNSFTSRYRQLFTVAVDGGLEIQLPIPSGLRASYSADGKKIAYIPISERFQQWKNYRGGTCSRVWIYDVADHSVMIVPQPEGRCNDTNPVFVGNKVYFRSDRNGEFNLYSYDLDSKELKQLTNFTEFPVQNLSGGEQGLALEQAGYLHLFEPQSGKLTQVKIGVTTDGIETRPRFVSGNQWIRNSGVSPSGARAVFEFRGEIVTVPAEKGDPRNLTNTPAVHERSPAWSPDGKSIAWFSDEGGEYQLVVAPQSGEGDRKSYKLTGAGFYDEPKWSPDGKKLSYRDNAWSLYVLDLESGRCDKITSEPQFGPESIRGLHHSWSADSQWIAYTVNTLAFIQQAFVYNVAENKSSPISDGMSEVSEPTFDPSGKYLYFFASTDAGPVKHWFAMSNADMETSNQLYVAVLQNDGANPFARESDEEGSKGANGGDKPAEANAEANTEAKPALEKEAGGEEKKAKPEPKKPTPVKIDFDGLQERIVVAPLPAARHSALAVGSEGQLFLIKEDQNGTRSLVNFSLKTRKATPLVESEVADFALTPDGKKLLYAAGKSWSIVESGGKPAASAAKLNLDAIQVRVDPRTEWNQIFEEVWRINRDYFYDPGMHGCDWAAMRERYRQFLPHCVTRDDLNRVLMWMCSELAVGHHRVGGGDDVTAPKSVPGGLLGADFEIDSGRYRVKKVYGGLNWNGELRSPLTEPGVRVGAGNYILAINGQELKADDNIYRLLENTSGKNVSIKVGPKADGSDAKTVTVVPITNESALRNRDWIERNLRRVQEATGGRVAYVYVPNTTKLGHEYFKRYFFPQTDKQAIIVDERFNGGGQVADYYIDHLRRPYASHWATRYGKDFITPTGTIFGPKVMLIDETAGSGGDMLPFMFRKMGVGTLIGRRTWGGLVGVLGFPVLMDGGSVSAPNLAIWTEEGFIVENEGVPPDIEVEQLPSEVIAGKDPQLEKAIEVVLKQLEENPPTEYKKPAFPIRARK
jgi:tricorn protease